MESKEGFEQPDREDDGVFEPVPELSEAPKPKAGKNRLRRFLRAAGMAAVVASGMGDRPASRPESVASENKQELVDRVPEPIASLAEAVNQFQESRQLSGDYIRALRELDIPIEWKDGEILFFPSQILLRGEGEDQKNPIPHTAVESVTRGLAKYDIALPSPYVMQTYERYISLTYEQNRYDATALARLSPELRKYANVPENVRELSFSEPRYTAHLVREFIRQQSDSSEEFFVVIYDQKEGVLHTDSDPVRGIKDSAPDSAAQLVGDRIAQFRRFREGNAAQKAGRYESAPFFDVRDESATGGGRKVYAVDILEPFTREERARLSDPAIADIPVFFSFSPDDEYSSYATARFSLGDIAQAGRFRVRTAESYTISNPADSVSETIDIYQKIFGEYERTGAIDPEIRLELGSGASIRIGNIDVANFEHRVVGPYHYYDVKFGGQHAMSSSYNIEHATGSVAHAEQLFGAKPGSLVRRIIADSRVPGSGGSYRSAKDTLAIFADRRMVLPEGRSDIHVLARHETAHLVDDRFNITLGYAEAAYAADPSPELKINLEHATSYHEAYRKLPRLFLERLAEGRFEEYNPELSFSIGHPWDNDAEFFASLINSLDMIRAEDVLKRRDAEFLGHYGQALQITLDRLNQIPALASVPVISSLRTRIAMVDALLQSSGAAKGVPE